MLRAYSFTNFLAEDTAMLKSRFLIILAQILLSILLISQIPAGTSAATCTGANPCHACKNCKYCKHCAKEGGTRGVCKKQSGLKAAN
jgi:hypothetical protein